MTANCAADGTVHIVTAVVYTVGDRSDGGQYGRRRDAYSLAQLRELIRACRRFGGNSWLRHQ